MHSLPQKKIGFIGLGAMGKFMAINIAKAKFPLLVYDLRKEPLAEMEKLGSKITGNARELGSQSDTVVVMVRTYPQLKRAVFPPEGVLGGMRKGSTLIVTSTIPPLEIQEVEKVARESGVAVIDAPVSGGRERAQDGTLTLMVGGDAKVINDNEDVLKAMGKYIYHVGGVGQGQTVKMINQLLVAAYIAATAEAMVLAKKLNINLPVLVDIVSKSVGDSFIWRTKAPLIIAGDFQARGSLSSLTKDARIIMDTGMELGVPLPITSVIYQLFQWAEIQGLGDLDGSAIVKLFEELARIKVADR